MGHLNDLAWSRLLSGDLGLLERMRLDRHLRACAVCRPQRAALEAERRAFEKSPDFARTIATLRARSSPARPKRRPGLGVLTAGLLVPAGAAAAFLLLPRLQRADDLVAKGGSAFWLAVRRGDRAEPFGDRCQPRDAVRGVYRSPLPNVVVVGTDGTGPAQELLRLEGHGPLAGETPGSWVLDGAPGRQCFTAIFSASPIALEEAANVAAGAAPPAQAQVVQRCCEKDAR